MSEWWTYTLSDFLLFSAKTYFRLFELYNRAIWPAQLIALATGVLLLVCVLRGGSANGRIAAATLAVAWLWVAWMFHVEYYAPINWAAYGFALAFAVEAFLLAWIGMTRDQWSPVRSASPAGRAGLGILLFALGAYPLLALLAGRPWRQVEIFGVTPDPTVLATVGVFLLASPRRAWLLLIIPFLWCAVSAATHWALGDWFAVFPLLAASLAVIGKIAQARLRRRAEWTT